MRVDAGSVVEVEEAERLLRLNAAGDFEVPVPLTEPQVNRPAVVEVREGGPSRVLLLGSAWAFERLEAGASDALRLDAFELRESARSVWMRLASSSLRWTTGRKAIR